MDLRVLGALTLDEGRIALPPRDRLVLGALAARIGRAVTVEAIATAVWGDALPASWSKVIPGCIMRLRRELPKAAIATTAAGYTLAPAAVELDAAQFVRLVERGSRLLELNEPDRAAHSLSEALGFWRGQPFAELQDWEPARIESDRLDEIRLAAEESLLEARLQSGDLVDAAAEARARVAESPMRERRWVILGLAQYRQGRQADALATIRRGRELLATELGLDPCAELATLEEAILRQDPELQSAAAFRTASAECPYFGLPPAGADDGERYFGREDELDRALQELERHAVLVVSGSSGVGKSSFVRAGIAAHYAARGRRVTVVTPGERPLEVLRELARHDGESLLIVDQCEQAFAIDDRDQTRRFFEEMGRLVFQGPLVMVIRADRLGDLADHHGFAGLIQSHLMMLGPLSADGLRAAIEKPARQAGLILEPGLVEVLVRDADGRSLPLLSHALYQVWQRREGRVLSIDGYHASGEIDGAVAQTAEEMFADLSHEGAGLARDILLRLVEPSRGGGVICQRVDRATVAVDESHARVAERLVDARLVTSDEDSFQLAHEAVAREWPRLQEWLADDVEGQRTMRHLNAAATAWEEMSRPDSELYRGGRLSAAVQWRESAQPVLAPVEVAFLDASVEREAADLDATRDQLQRERRSVRRLRRLAGATAALAVLALAAGALAAVQTSVANERAVMDDARRVAALAAAEPVYERALLMAVEAIRLWDAPATRRSLLDIMERSPRIASVTRLGDNMGIETMMLGRDDSTVLVIDDTITAGVIDLDERAPIAVADVGGGIVLDAAEGPGGGIALSVMQGDCGGSGWCEAPDLRTFDIGRGSARELTFPVFGSEVLDIEYSRDESLAAMIAPLPWMAEGANVAVWRVDTPDEPLLLRLPQVGTNPGPPSWANSFGRVRFSADGTRLYASGFGPTAVFDTADGALLDEIEGDGLLAVSPDGQTLLLREGRQAARIVDLADPSRSRLLEMDADVVDGAFSPDGTAVATASGDRAWLWRARTGDLLEVLAGHRGIVRALAFRSTGELVTAGKDGALFTWALDDWTESFRVIRDLSGQPSLRDERALIYALPNGGHVRVSADDPDIWVERACAIAGRGLSEEEWQEVFADRPHDPACAKGAPSALPE
ncbi:BTAD domain-containing putative transcriptional regulator [Microbacterium sp. PRC9]|uniref:nSTAND1 domain-containing NTPase n=1 Tax=Microbacterium sp. PRC9 TaxID=2962591 RepID=UPI002882CB70|nr:BTAD domain-containing putative transcriptional regulator [Microbacterium sp. PRC9]MDT0144142.1 BTAD domain-containing putative transcriptional regulator [Microbacterium sp. PRC9]